MKTITGTIGAWLTDYRIALNADPSDFSELTFSTVDMEHCGWLKVGDAEITVTLRDPNEITSGKIAVLNEAKRLVNAEAEAQITRIESQIQSLLAIEYKG